MGILATLVFARVAKKMLEMLEGFWKDFVQNPSKISNIFLATLAKARVATKISNIFSATLAKARVARIPKNFSWPEKAG